MTEPRGQRDISPQRAVPKYIPKWFRDKVDERLERHPVSTYRPIRKDAIDAMYRLCWAVYHLGHDNG